MLESYSKTKERLIGILARAESVAGSGRAGNAVRSLRAKLEDNVFSLVVVGQFKRGKTTFINALLGRDLLPTAVIPMTSIITVISYGSDLRITVWFESGTRQEIALDDLPLFVTERHNPRNEKGVSRVNITYPSPYLKNGVRIVDTPGVASVHEHNTKTTYEYLPQADAAIFLLSVEPPLTRAELHFLRDLKNLVVRTFFILNKIDAASDADLKELLAFSRAVIENEAGFADASIFPLSARKALEGKKENDPEKLEESGLPVFERALDSFLMEDKGRALLRSAVEKAGHYIAEETLLAELENRSLRSPLDELEGKIAAFQKFVRDSEQEKIDSGRLLAEEVKGLERGALAEDLDRLKQEKTRWLTEQVGKFAAEHESDGNAIFAELLDEFVGTQIRDIFGAWRAEEERALKGRLEEVLGRFAGRMDKILGRITRYSAELFGIVGREFRIYAALPPQIEFRFQTADEPDALSLAIDLTRKALPRKLAHRLFLKDARRKVAEMIDRHCGKARYDFSQRLERLAQNYQRSVTEAVSSAQKDVLDALENALAARQKTAAEIAARETQISDRVTILKEIKESLAELM
jgi:GTPase SAR1 family protein